MKSQVPVFFDKWLTLMEEAWEALNYGQYKELEEKIRAEITYHRNRDAKSIDNA